MGTCLGVSLLPSNPLAAGAMRLWRRHEGRSHNTVCVTSFLFLSDIIGLVLLYWFVMKPPWTSRFSCVQVLVKAGDKVTVGDPLMVMIAMKMEVRHWWFLPFSRCTHTAEFLMMSPLVFASAAYDPGAKVRCDQEGSLQRGLSGQPPRSSGWAGGGGRAGGGRQPVNASKPQLHYKVEEG